MQQYGISVRLSKPNNMASTASHVFTIEGSRNWSSTSKEHRSFKGGRRFVRPLTTSLIAAIGSLTLGTTIGYSSLAVEDINSHRNRFRIDQDQFSWFASLNILCTAPGSLASSWLMDRLGRKLTLMLGSLPVVVGWVVIVGAENMATMYAGRVVSSVGCGVLLPIVGVYISETATPQLRGRLCAIQEMALNVGILFAYVAGDFLPWTWLGIACASWACVLAVASAFVLPESPRWLVYKRRSEEATESLAWLRCVHKTQVLQELSEIENSLNGTRIVPWIDYFRPPMLKYFSLSVALFVFYEFSGIQVIRIYTMTILKESGGSGLSNNDQTIVVGVLMTIGTVICTLFVDRIERRTLLVFSASVVCIGNSALGAYFKVLDTNPNFAAANLSSWLPLASMVLATVGFEVGCGPLTHILASECFSTQARARVNSAGCIVMGLSGFLQAKFFPDISRDLGLAGAFWLSAGVSLLEIIVGYFAVPKTRNRTLEMIQQDLGQ